MNPARCKEINGHEVAEYAWGRDMIVYMDCYRWDASYEAALAWAERHEEGWNVFAQRMNEKAKT